MISRIVFLTAALAASSALAQQATMESGLPTQTLIKADSKNSDVLTVAQVALQVNGKATPVTSLEPLRPAGTQVALLIDDGLSRNAGIQLSDLQAFAKSLPATTELLIGYMQYGTIKVETPFTTDHAAAAASIRIPVGIPDESASPYFCLDEFVKHWPGAAPGDEGTPVKARFVMMLTNGVDPYNGSTSMLNQDSPYVEKAQVDAERAGVAVSSIYYSDAGFRGRGSFSGQSYLAQVAEATGGALYNEGPINPVSLTPLLQQFQRDLSETYIVTFNTEAAAGGRDHLVRLKFTSDVAKQKIRHPDQVRPGNRENGVATATGDSTQK